MVPKHQNAPMYGAVLDMGPYWWILLPGRQTQDLIWVLTLGPSTTGSHLVDGTETSHFDAARRSGHSRVFDVSAATR